MTTGSGSQRNAGASRIIKAARRTIFQAFLDPQAVVSWLPPKGMKGCMHEFDAREGGTYRMSLIYLEPGHHPRGKSSDDTDIVRARCAIGSRRAPDRVAGRIRSQDPAVAVPMIIRWTLADVRESARSFQVSCENAPEAIQAEDHQAGFRVDLGKSRRIHRRAAQHLRPRREAGPGARERGQYVALEMARAFIHIAAKHALASASFIPNEVLRLATAASRVSIICRRVRCRDREAP